MKLKELLHGLDVLELHADETLDITGVPGRWQIRW